MKKKDVLKSSRELSKDITYKSSIAQWFLKNISYEKRILFCGQEESLLSFFRQHGYKKLFLLNRNNSDCIEYFSSQERVYKDQNDLHPKYKYDVIVFFDHSTLNQLNRTEIIIKKYSQYLTREGVFVLDFLDSEKNISDKRLVDTLDIDSNKKDSNNENSYFKNRIEDIANNNNYSFIFYNYTNTSFSRFTYILKRNKLPSICLLCDVPNWAFDHSATEICCYLSNMFDFDIKYVVDKPDLDANKYDLLHVFFWGETYYKKFNFPKYKILKEVSSFRWSDNPLYGPCTPREMYDKFLLDANHVFCTSKILYNLFKDISKNIHLVENGFSPEKFFYKNERSQEITLCWAGNIKDPIKGVKDIIIPAVGNKYKFDIASNLNHKEMNDFYNNHDVVIVASKHEAEPLTILEAMASGCFPVVNSVGLIPELITHKVNGYIVKERNSDAYKEAFEWCNRNLNYIREAGRNNASYMLEHKAWSIMAEGFKKMYVYCLKDKNYFN